MKKSILLLIILQGCFSNSSLEQEVCDCLEANYQSHQNNYLDQLSELEQFLTISKRIDENLKSRIELHTYLSESKHPAFFNPKRDNKLSLIGFETFAYCLKSVELQRGCDEYHWALELKRRIRKVDKEYGPLLGEIEEYQAAKNSLIKEYLLDDGKDEKLKRLFILNELNKLIPDSLMFDILEGRLHKENLKYQKIKISSSEIINIHAGPNKTVHFNEQPLTMDELCSKLMDMFDYKRNIHLSTEGGTVYGHYLKVQEKVKSCVIEYHNQKCRQLYHEEIENIDEHLQKKLLEDYRIRIIESRSDK